MTGIAQAIIQNQMSGLVPEASKHKKRYPFIFLIDISGSTGVGTDPDIHHINRAVADLLDQLRNPPPSAPHVDTVDQIDFCIITYSNAPTIEVPWTDAPHLPPSIPPFVPGGTTHTADALEFAITQIRARLNYYKDPANNIASNIPHIIHLSDGKPTDMAPGDPRWQKLQTRLSRIDGNKNIEEKLTTIFHFVAPNGCLPDHVNNNPSGQEILAALSGKGAVYDTANDVGNFSQMVEVVTLLIANITHNFSSTDAIDDAIGSAATPPQADYPPMTEGH